MQARLTAVLEAVGVLVVTLAVIGAFAASPLAGWERRALQRTYIEYALMIAVPLAILAVTRRPPAAYGLSLNDLRYHLDVALTCFIPYSAAWALQSMLRLSGPWPHLLSAALALGLLPLFGWLLRRKPAMGALAGALALAMPLASPAAGKAASALLFYTCFLGPGEEVLFRGYIQSRLNGAFARPYRFFGVNWGWGLAITALLFGLYHVANLPALYAGRLDPAWWALTSACWGLVFGLLREKTGSVVAPALLHGLPQAIAWALLGL